MGKRKPTTSGDLRTSPIHLHVHRHPKLNTSAWGITNAQPFFPPVETLFKTEMLDSVEEYGIRTSDPIAAVIDANTIRTASGATVNVHRKTTMLLSPYGWMEGEFGTTLGLPTSKEKSELIHSKLQNPHTAGYVGAILSLALSESKCLHFPKVYGTYVGMAKEFVLDISDDYAELSETSWFSQNIGKTFDIRLAEHAEDVSSFRHTRSARIGLHIGEDVVLDGVDELSVEDVEASAPDLEPMFQDTVKDDDGASDSSSVSTSYIFDIRSCSTDGEEEHLEDGNSGEPFAWATFKNVPVQVTVMEKCEGTLYELLVIHPDEHEKHTAWLAQVVFALAFAQRNFGFTHNDLHANNVMYIKTNEETLGYSHNGNLYRVPTYGYLIKIIDFDRGIGSIRLPSMKEAKLFMSDQFHLAEEAGGQYNFAPFYVPKYPEIKPNPSFDLVRLATSLFWDLFPMGPKYDDYQTNPIFHTFLRWMKLEDGSSVLFGKSADMHDRYHGFHLYKAIARYSKDVAVPRKEIGILKGVFGVESLPAGMVPLLIES